MSDFLWSAFFLLIVLGGVAKIELSEQCEQHGKALGKTMQWNVFGGCEEVRK